VWKRLRFAIVCYKPSIYQDTLGTNIGKAEKQRRFRRLPIMEVVSSLDIFPTTLALAGIPLPTDRLHDGNDITPLLQGVPGAKAAKAWFFYFTTCSEHNGCPPTNITDGCPSGLIKYASFALPFDAKNDQFTKTGSGQT
jgi:arylsulfatase A-like enzyme